MGIKEIFDDERFFNKYLELRDDKNNYNDLIEQPIIFSLLGDIRGKSILDIGCGYGSTTLRLSEYGASKVIGIDASNKMIMKANIENKLENIDYKVLNAVDLNLLTDKFDIVVSCLAIHYIENIDKLFKDIYNILSDNGTFVFSMEHPIFTASIDNTSRKWLYNRRGEVSGFILDNYSKEGVRKSNWLNKDLIKYHYKTSTIINKLVENGFVIDKLEEPSPTRKMVKALSKAEHEIHRPVFLIIKCHKN